MGTAIESGIGALNYGKQSAKGTKAVAATTTVGYNRPKWADGGLTAKKTLGEQDYIDGQRFASPATYTNSVGGEAGTPKIKVQPENGGLFMAQILGVDVVTGSADPWTHTITSAGTSGAWGTWWQKVGSAVGPEREMFWDSKIGNLTMNVSSDEKSMHYDMAIFALVAGEIFTTDPAKTEDATDPFYWTEVTGAATFDATVLTETNGETLEIATGMSAYWGDDTAPNQLIEGKGAITRTLQAIVTDTTLAKYRLAVYNNATPAAGDKPVKDVFYAACSTVYTKSATRTITFTTPKIAVKPDDFQVFARVAGGAIPIAFGGKCHKSGATPALTVVALTGDSGAY